MTLSSSSVTSVPHQPLRPCTNLQHQPSDKTYKEPRSRPCAKTLSAHSAAPHPPRFPSHTKPPGITRPVSHAPPGNFPARVLDISILHQKHNLVSLHVRRICESGNTVYIDILKWVYVSCLPRACRPRSSINHAVCLSYAHIHVLMIACDRYCSCVPVSILIFLHVGVVCQ